jgi:TolB-like protein/Flp pilus assembly protein TadD
MLRLREGGCDIGKVEDEPIAVDLPRMASAHKRNHSLLHVVEKPQLAEKPAPRPAAKQLRRILRSETFHQCDRLKRFLTFIVQETAAGRASDLKEYVIGVQVFRKEDSFDPRTDPIVRVQARRLRAKLVRYYREEGRADPTLIELPKGGYIPLIKRRDDATGPRRTVSTALVTRNTITVLPFEDHSGDGSLDAIRKGIRSEVVHHLARLPGLRILADRAPDAPPQSDPSTSGGALIIGGDVRQSGSRLRITVHLIDSVSGCYLWSEAIDGSADDAFRVQEEIAATVANKLDEAAPGGRARATRPAANLAAQNLYLQGRYHLNQRTEDGLRKALDFFERALTEDAQYAVAHSGMADAYGLLAHYGVRGPADVWSKAASSATSAVMLDVLSAEAHTSLALVKATQHWDWTAAEREYQRAISLDPKYATAHHWYAASCLAPLGRLDEALDEILLAQSLDPVSSIVSRDVAMVHYYRRDFETALEQCDQTIELNPHFAPAYWLLGLIQAQRRDFDESLAAVQRAVHLSPQTPRMHGALGRTLALSGRRRRALEVLRTLESYASERYVSPLEVAWIQFALGEIDLGFQWLTKACDDRSFDLISVKVDPRFDPLRDDDRFVGILKQLGLD